MVISTADRAEGPAALAGRSVAIAALRAAIRVAARRDTPVLLLAPPGAEIEEVARAIHMGSPRADGTFGTVTAGSLDLDDPACGTGGQGGTLFVSAIDSLSFAQQAKFTAILDQQRLGPPDGPHQKVRFIAATAADLSMAMRTGRFQAELYFRIAAHPVRVPPLSDRAEDAPIIAARWLQDCARAGSAVRPFTPDALSALGTWRWPGDMAELYALLERLACTPGLGAIAPADVAHALRPSAPPALRLVSPDFAPCDLDEILRETERTLIDQALARADGVVAEAARLLGLRRTTLIDRIRKHGLRPSRDVDCPSFPKAA